MPVNTKPKIRFRLRTILIVVNLTVLLLPLGGFFFFRVYENELVRQTEMELISQCAVIASIYKDEMNQLLGSRSEYGKPLGNISIHKVDSYYTPILPQLDLSRGDPMPPRPNGRQPVHPADDLAIQAGQIVSPVMKEAQKTTLSGMKLLDSGGVTIAGQTELGLSFAHVEEVKEALQGRYTSVIRQRISDEPTPPLASISRGTLIRVFVAFPILHQKRLWGVVYLSRTPKNILKYLYDEKDKVFLAVSVAMVLALMLVLFTSQTISRPIHQLIGRTRQVAAGNPSAMQPLESPITQEIEWLSKSFSEMALTLHDRSQYLQEFASHVSHEFKTPLTSIQGAAELLLEHIDEMPKEKQNHFLGNIINDTNRLKRLVAKLLELAKADNLTPSAETTSTDLVFQTLKETFKNRNLSIHLISENDFEVEISSELFETILTNLLNNSEEHGASSVEISLARENQELILIFCDDGEGISEANRKKIFTPFFTTKRDEGGTGLGLRIVKTILKAHKGEIRLLDSDRGACLMVTLPLALPQPD